MTEEENSETKKRDLAAEKLAAKMLERLPRLLAWSKERRESGNPPRAFVIEFAGMPKAGKSSAIETIRHFFSHGPKTKVVGPNRTPNLGYRVHTPAEGVSLRTPNYLKRDPTDFNTWAGAYALQELLQARHEFFYDLVILDRGPWDAACWLEHIAQYDPPPTRTADAASRITEFFRLPSWQVLADLHVVLIVDPETSNKRERDERLIDHKGPASDKKRMKEMREIYETRFKSLQRDKAHDDAEVDAHASILIDTTGMRQKEVAVQIIDRALQLVEAKLERNQLVRVSKSLENMRVSLPIETQAAFEDFVPGYIRRTARLTHEERSVLCPTLNEKEKELSSEPEALLLHRGNITFEKLSAELDQLLHDAAGDNADDD